MPSETNKVVSDHMSRVGREGGLSRSDRKRHSSAQNLVKAREKRLEYRLHPELKYKEKEYAER